ncbi:MAG: sugar transferase, partial [Acutalibacteraceae bacterium]
MYKKYIKRIFDFVCALIMVVVLSPLLLIISLFNAAGSKGPVFFLQERIGKDGRVFKIIKFRTMVVGAEKVGSGIRTSSNDSRITKVGAVLRKTSLDELPQ